MVFLCGGGVRIAETEVGAPFFLVPCAGGGGATIVPLAAIFPTIRGLLL